MSRRRTQRTSAGALVLAFAAAVSAPALVASPPPFAPRLPDRALWPQGRYVYERHCVICHGKYGDGGGDMGRKIVPPPRNFARGIFKYRSTPAGSLPSDEDLARTIRAGLPGTAMPVFNQLNEREVQSVIEYLKSFSPRWESATNYAAPLPLPATPSWLEEESQRAGRAERGRELFGQACAACHGPDGSGRGATARELEDSFGQPPTPTDLRLPALRSGRGFEATYRVLVTGIDATPMPSFAEATTAEQRWELVAFIVELRRAKASGANP